MRWLAQEREQLQGRPERGSPASRADVPRICWTARMMESVAERSQGGAGALSAPEVDRRDPFARLGMGDREATRPEKPDGVVDLDVSHDEMREGGGLNPDMLAPPLAADIAARAL